jgi:hypothetical protein
MADAIVGRRHALSGGGQMMKRVGWRSAMIAAITALATASAALAAPAWNPTTAVSPGGVTSDRPAVAVDAHGNAVALWLVSSAHNEVVYSDHPAGGSWTAPVVLSDPAQEAASPVVALDANGDAFAAWSQTSSGAQYQIHASYRPAGGSWQATPDLFGSPTVISFMPTLAVNARGDEVLGWESYTDGTLQYSGMWGDYRPAGGSWTTATLLSPGTATTTKPSVLQPAAAIDAYGNAAVVWSFRDYNAAAVHAVVQVKYYNSTVALWHTYPSTLSTATHESLGAKVAMFGNGHYTVIWAENDLAGHGQVIGRDGTDTTLTALFNVSPVGTTVKDPSLAFYPNGDAVAAWSFGDGTGAKVQSATRPAGGSWPVVPTGVGNTAADAQTTAIAIAANGDAVVSWQEQPVQPGAYHVDTAVKPAGAAWSAPHDASGPMETAPLATSPAVADDGQGNAIVLWDQSGTSNRRIQAATYSAPAIETLTIPSSGVVGQPVNFSDSPFDVWSPLSTTWNFGDGTTAAGTSVTHTYTSAGQRTVTVSSANAGLATANAAGSITISAPVPPPGGGTPPGSPSAPKLTAVSESSRFWARANKLARVTAKRKTPVGTTISLTLDQAATLRFAFSQTVTGRSVGGRCAAPTRSNHKRRACKLSMNAGTLVLTGHVGGNRVTFFGQMTRTHQLEKGRYTVSITASNSSGKVSSPTTLVFAIIK